MEKYSVKKPFTVLVAVLIVFLMGFVSLTNLRTDLLPEISTPYLMVVTVYPGASPEKVETEVSEVLESALGTVAGVSSITSTSAENYSIVQLSFGADTDMNSALVKVSNTLDQNADSLPDICLTPSILELSMDMQSLMTVAVGREGADIYELSDFLDESVLPELERQEGVSSISATGLVEEYIQVQLNQDKIDDLNVLLLEEVDEQLAIAKQQLDEAAQQLADGKAQLQQAIDTFGDVFASGVMDRVAGMVSEATAELRDKVQTLMDAIDNLIAFVNEPEIQAALINVRDGLAEIMDEIADTGLRDINDLIDVMVKGADPNISDEKLTRIEQGACPTCGSCSGMFTANSMNCLTEALGLSLPGNGTIVATHANRRKLFEAAAKLIVKNAREYYFNDNDKVLPRSIATREAFLNAMSLDIAMGGSTNTVLHLLAVAREAGVDFTMKDIDTLSRKLPVLCKVAPNHSPYHIQEVNRAGGILAILGILMRAGLIDGTTLRADGLTLAQAIAKYDIYNLGTTATSADTERYLSAPGGKFNITLGSQRNMYPDYDTDRAQGCIRDIDHAYMKDGGLAVLYGNIAADGCIVKTAGVDASILVFDGTACVFDSQEQASKGILDGTVKAGDIVIIRYEGPKGGPGMQEMLYPTSYLKTVKLDKACALLTDGRFSGGTSGLSIGHCSPEAAAGGLIAAVENGDKIHIDIPNRTITLEVADDVLAQRMEQIRTTTGFRPNRQRTVSKALQAYANMVSSADKGAIRIVE